MFYQHLNHEQVCKTKYSSTIECHTELFEAARVSLLLGFETNRFTILTLSR